MTRHSNLSRVMPNSKKIESYIMKPDSDYMKMWREPLKSKKELHPDNEQVARVDRGSGAVPREESFGQMAELGRPGG